MIMNVAIIGCGRIGCGFDDNLKGKYVRTHAGSYFQNPKTKLVALCDIDKKKLSKYGIKYKVNGLYTKSSEMFLNENLDCVSICTLANSHLDLVKQATKNKVKAIFLEKPISDSLVDSKKIVEICKKTNTLLLINHRRRFDPFFDSIRKIIHEGKLGDLQLITVYYGAGITNTCSHVFDVLRMFFGEVKNVDAKISKNNSGNPNDPNLDVDLEFKNGKSCILRALDVKNYGMLEMDIFGTKSRFRFNLESNSYEYFKVASGARLVYKNLINSKIKLKKSKLSSMQLGVENLVNCVEKKAKPMCTGIDGYGSLEIIIAALLSSYKKQKIHLPLKKYNFKIKSR